MKHILLASLIFLVLHMYEHVHKVSLAADGIQC